MSAAMIDTHAVIKRLIASGMPEGQAEAVTMIVRESRDDMAGAAATKVDIAKLESSIEAAKAELRLDLRSGLAETKADIMKWIIGALGIQTLVIIGALAALLKSMPH